MVDPCTPVLVGAGQAQQRAAEPLEALEPIDLLATAARTAETDSGARRSVLGAVDTVATVEMVSWPYPDPGALLARRLGIEAAATMTSTVGGNSPQLLLNELAASVAAGERRVVLLGGGECVHTRWRARRDPKTWLPWTQADDPPCPVVIGDPRPGTNDYEMAHTAVAPTTIYPLFETALRARRGHGIDAHQVQTSELLSGFAAVARDNPHAWAREGWSASEIRTVAPDNRVVAFPYTKRMCANIDVDQAAAVLLCSHEAARELGVPDERMVFPLAGADARDHFYVSERWSLAESPAIRSVGRAALEASGLTIDDVARFDLYSCFPSAVQIAMEALGLAGTPGGDSRPLTVTGGLGFAGGPANNYPTHAIATMVDACRRDPGSVGMVTALGWYVTKHSAGMYSTSPPPDGFRRVPASVLQPELDARPRREPAGAYEGAATIEATSVVFTREGAPELGIVAALTPDGRRVLANSRETGVLASMVDEPWEGRTVPIATDGTTNVLAA